MVTNLAKTINFLYGWCDFSTLPSIKNVIPLPENEQKQLKSKKKQKKLQSRSSSCSHWSRKEDSNNLLLPIIKYKNLHLLDTQKSHRLYTKTSWSYKSSIFIQDTMKLFFLSVWFPFKSIHPFEDWVCAAYASSTFLILSFRMACLNGAKQIGPTSIFITRYKCVYRQTYTQPHTQRRAERRKKRIDGSN